MHLRHRLSLSTSSILLEPAFAALSDAIVLGTKHENEPNVSGKPSVFAQAQSNYFEALSTHSIVIGRRTGDRLSRYGFCGAIGRGSLSRSRRRHKRADLQYFGYSVS